MNFPSPAVLPEQLDVTICPDFQENAAPSTQVADMSPLLGAMQQLPEVILPDDQHGLLMRVHRLDGVLAASLLDPAVVKALAIVQRNFTAAGFGIELGLQSDHGPIELFGVGDNIVAVVLDPEKAEDLREQVRACLAKVRRFLS